MDKQKVMAIFDELLEDWAEVEEFVIMDRAVDSSAYDDLAKRKVEVRKRFLEALGE